MSAASVRLRVALLSVLTNHSLVLEEGNHPVGPGRVLVQMCLASWYSARPSRPSSRPKPECPKPPHSAAGTYGPKSLIQIVPWRRRAATSSQLPWSDEKTAPASPYEVSLPMRTASSRSVKVSTVSTGPNDSSCTTAMSWVQRSRIVGG